MKACTHHWHLVDLSGVVLFDITKNSNVISLDEVDGHTLAAIPARATDTVDVELTIVGKIIVDHQRYLSIGVQHKYVRQMQSSPLPGPESSIPGTQTKKGVQI